jgi:hypothetical protein
MQFLRTLFSKLPVKSVGKTSRKYAQVHDITIKADDNRILGSMERNGTFLRSQVRGKEMDHEDGRVGWDRRHFIAHWYSHDWNSFNGGGVHAFLSIRSGYQKDRKKHTRY